MSPEGIRFDSLRKVGLFLQGEQGEPDESDEESDDLDICPICHEACSDAFQLKCQHSYCLECLSTWAKVPSSDPTTCPVCRRFLPKKLDENLKNMVFAKRPVISTVITTMNESGDLSLITQGDMNLQAESVE